MSPREGHAGAVSAPVLGAADSGGARAPPRRLRHHCKERIVTDPDLNPRRVKKFGWVPDIPDARDFLYSAPEPVLSKMPTKVDLRPKCPPIYDQGQLGSCTANAIGAAFEFDQMKQGLQDFMPSRLFIYYNERAIEGTIDSDSGA